MSTVSNLTLTPKAGITDAVAAYQWLNERLRAGRNKFFIEVVTMTPVLAAEMLATNPDHNRRVRDRVVEDYARAMRDGRWLLTSQGISFCADGTLDNGQHRLMAVIKSGENVPMTVAFGQSGEVFAVLDSGSRRAASDALRTVGFSHEAVIAGMATRIANISEGAKGRTIRPTHDEIVNMALSDKHIQPAARIGHRLGRALKSTDVGFGLGAYYLLKANRKADDFFDRISSGIIYGARDPIKYLRERAMMREFTGDAGIYQAAAQMINAWNIGQAGRGGRPDWDAEDPFPTVKV